LVEAHHLSYVATLHHRDVDRVSSRKPGCADDDAACALHVDDLDRVDHVDGGRQKVECVVDIVVPPDRSEPMEDLLEHLGVGTHRLVRRDRLFEQPSRRIAQRMGSPDDVHRDVRVDEDHPGCSS
jgi:hypothetical protein